MSPQRSMAWAGEVHSPLYLGSIIVVGIWLNEAPAVLLSVLTMGLAYFCGPAKAYEARGSWVAFALYLVTVGVGAAAGVVLGLMWVMRVW